MTLFNPSSARTNNAATGFAARVMSGASLLLRPGAGFYGAVAANGIEIDPSPDLLRVSVARASAAWDSQSTLQNGERVGRLIEYGPNRVRAGAAGIVKETAAATNLFRNPRLEGAEPGFLNAGGLLPFTGFGTDRFFVSGATSAQVEVIGYVLRDGWVYLRLRFVGTINATVQVIAPNTTSNPAASASTQYAVGVNVVHSGGALNNVSTILSGMNFRDSGGAVTNQLLATVTPDAEGRRFTSTTAAGAGSTYAHIVLLRFAAAGAVDATFDIAAFQLETGSASTSPVFPPPLEPGESTRAAETFTFDGFEGVRASREYYVGEDGSLSVFGVNATAFGTRGIPVFMETTNRIRNPRGLGLTPGVIGSGGAYPTNWGQIVADHTQEIVGRFEDETGTFVRLKWTTTGAGEWRILFDTTTQIIAAPNDWFAYHCRVRLAGGSAQNFTGVLVRGAGRTSGGSLTEAGQSEAVVPTPTPQPVELIRQLTNASTERFSPEFRILASGACDITIDIYEPQVERGRRFASPPALPGPTEIAEATRAASAPRIITRPQLFQRTGVTILGEVILSDFFGTSSSRQVFGQINNGSVNLRHDVHLNPSGNWLLFSWDGASIVTNQNNFTANAARPRQRIAMRFSDANVGWAVSDGLNTYSKFDLVPARSLQLENCTRINPGSEGGNRQLNGFITDFRVIPGLLTDAQLSEYVAF